MPHIQRQQQHTDLRSQISRGGGGKGALFLEQFLTSGGNPYVKENEQQVINNKWNKRVGER